MSLLDFTDKASHFAALTRRFLFLSHDSDSLVYRLLAA